MKQLFQNVRFEWLLLIRNRFLFIPYALNILLWVITIWNHSKVGTSLLTVEAEFYAVFLFLLLLNLFLVGIIAVYIANRDYASKFEQVAFTYPIQNWQWVISKWFVVQMYGLMLTCMTICIQWLWLMIEGIEQAAILKQMVYVFVQMEAALFLMISFGFLFAKLIRNVLSYLTIPALLILLLLLPMDSTGESLIYDNPLLHLFTFIDYRFVETPYESIWGVHRVFSHTLIHQFAVIVISFIIICSVIAFFNKQRSSKNEQKTILSAMIVFFMIGIGLFTYQFLDYKQKLKHFITTGQQYMRSYEDVVEEIEQWEWENNYYNEKLDDIAHHFSMEQSNLQVNLKPKHELEAMAVFTVKNIDSTAMDEIPITLNRQLTIHDCQVDNMKECNREADFVTIQLTKALEPQEKTEVILSYSGNIVSYYDEGKNEGSFIDKKRIYLPKSAGWYPLIGHRPLLIAIENERNYVGFSARPPHLVEPSPTKFTVHIQSEEINIPLALPIPEVSKGKYEGVTTYGLDVIGGDLQEQEIGGIRVINNLQIEKNVEKLVVMYNDVWKVTKNWLDIDLQPETIYALPGNQYSWLSDTPADDFYLLDERNYETKYEDIIREVVYPIFSDHRPSGYDTESDASLYYDYELFIEMISWGIYTQVNEDIAFMELTEEDFEHMDPIYLDKIETMKQIEAKGREKFLSLIQYIYQEWLELENKHDFNLDQLVKQFEEEVGI